MRNTESGNDKLQNAQNSMIFDTEFLDFFQRECSDRSYLSILSISVVIVVYCYFHLRVISRFSLYDAAYVIVLLCRAPAAAAAVYSIFPALSTSSYLITAEML